MYQHSQKICYADTFDYVQILQRAPGRIPCPSPANDSYGRMAMSAVMICLFIIILFYLVSENFMLTPKSMVVVGYELVEISGIVVCLSK